MKKETIFTLSAILSVALLVLIVFSVLFAGAADTYADRGSSAPTGNMKIISFSPSSSSSPAPKIWAISTLEKETVANAMLNSVDYYQSAEGEFTTTSLHDHQETTVTYKTDLTGGSSYQHISDSETDAEQFVKDGALTKYDNRTKSYSQSYVPQPYEPANKTDQNLEARITVGSDGIKNYYYRNDATHTGIATMSLFPQEMTFGLLSDTDLWEITRETGYLGRSCAVLSGKTAPSYGSKLNMERFTLYVDEATGILLKFEGFSKKGLLTQSIATKNISIDTDGLADRIDRFVSSQVSRDKYGSYTEIRRTGSPKLTIQGS
ncbi:hypothetical protein EQM14_10735 [Caproiciproducens sp. NJN-50]|uniref:hypothetical protein n=1 Tax=Acutalibacteraceae TaxID=3082771 RepID=UPI000FFE2E31|nr:MULTISPECIES: hypothetical protein [Acutalibacteraceae]QAT50204.1 hypothetical protein EQM14_10735 [Caproiciproducens sp. NJN-50]